MTPSESDRFAASLIQGGKQFGVRRNEAGLARAIVVDGWDVLHLFPGTCRNEACVNALVEVLNAVEVINSGGAGMMTNDDTEGTPKLYFVENRETLESHTVQAGSAQEACEKCGWRIAHCYVVRRREISGTVTPLYGVSGGPQGANR